MQCVLSSSVAITFYFLWRVHDSYVKHTYLFLSNRRHSPSRRIWVRLLPLHCAIAGYDCANNLVEGKHKIKHGLDLAPNTQFFKGRGLFLPWTSLHGRKEKIVAPWQWKLGSTKSLLLFCPPKYMETLERINLFQFICIESCNRT